MKLTTGHTIRVIRMHQGIKQGKLEKTLGISQGRLARIEVQNADLSVKLLLEICKELKTSPEEFFKIKEGV